jgi:tryptophan-rich sensory protein
VQLLLNTLWTPIFFSLKSIGGALIDIILLNLSIIVNIYVFYKRDKTAGLLLLPYLVWVCFAFYLNLMIWYWNVLKRKEGIEEKDNNKYEKKIHSG